MYIIDAYKTLIQILIWLRHDNVSPIEFNIYARFAKFLKQVMHFAFDKMFVLLSDSPGLRNGYLPAGYCGPHYADLLAPSLAKELSLSSRESRGVRRLLSQGTFA